MPPRGKAISDGGVAGLYLFPSSERGRGKWILRYVSPFNGKRRDMGLGQYPGVSIASARKAALEARELIRAKIDPIENRNEAVASAQKQSAAPNFEVVARRVFEELRPGFRSTKHAEQWITTLATYVFPKLGHRFVSDLRASDFADALRPIWLTKPETASRVRQRCDAVMKWCAAKDYVIASPVVVIDKLLPRQPGKRERVAHHPALPWREIPTFFQNILYTSAPSTGRQALEFLILTASRSGEVRGMLWSEIDWEHQTWTIPASRMKAKVAHRIPLSLRALELLTERRNIDLGTDLVFPSRRTTPLSDMALTKVLRDANVQSDIPGRLATAHGFRSSFRDWASENGYPRDLAERALAHIIRNSAEAAYHRTDLLEARRKLMEAWERCALRGPIA